MMTGLVAEVGLVHQKTRDECDDLNDLFSSISCFESKALDGGFREGLEDGRKESATKGFVLGFNTGSNISLDLGYAAAFCAVILQPININCADRDRPCNPHLIRLCEEIINLAKLFPATNLETEDLILAAEEIKIKLDKIKSLLNVHLLSTESKTVKQKYTF